MSAREGSPRRGGGSLFAVALSVVAVICCLAAPLLAGALGGAALSPRLGLLGAIAAGAVVAVGCFAMTRTRRRGRRP